MTSSGAYVLAVVCEADADRRVSTALADRVLCQDVEWIEPESIDHYRRWQGLEGRSFLGWTEAARLAKQKGFRVHGHFDGLPAAPDAVAARKALLLLMDEARFPDAVLLMRDSDGDLRRRQGLEQARAGEGQWPFPIILGIAHPKRECWVLAGFEPTNAEEGNRLEALRKELGSDPRTQAHELTAKETGAPRDAKRVLAKLTQGRAEREEICWTDKPLESLQERGVQTGLADYLQEIRERLVPLFGSSSSRHTP